MINKLTKHAGEKTGQFGRWLTDSLKDDTKYQVYYDHGAPTKFDNVAVIKSFIGKELTNKTRLADIDVMVYNTDHEILLLIEIEESSLSPKTLFGDRFSILFSAGFSVNDGCEKKYFTVTPKTHLIIGGFVKNFLAGGKEKIEEIQKRLTEFTVPTNTIAVENIDFVIEKDLKSCIRGLKEIVHNTLFPEV